MSAGLANGVPNGPADGLLDRLADRLNPITVKELRQAARGRFLIAVYFGLLLLQVINLTVQLLGEGISELDLLADQQPGRQVAIGAAIMLVLMTVLAVPVATAARLFAERAAEGIDLLFVTSLSPRRIVAGKLEASLVLVLVLTSACAPFLAFTYFLRGVDLVVLAVALAAIVTVSTLAILVAIATACIGGSPVLRALVALPVGLGLFVATISTMVWVGALLSGEVTGLGTVEANLGLLAFFAIAAAAGRLLFEVAVALVSPPVANRARAPRVFLTVAWVLSAVALRQVDLHWPGTQAWTIWVLLWAHLAGFVLLVAVSARDQPSRRMAREIPHGALRRAGAFLFASGSGPGLAWTLGLLAATLAVGWAAAATNPTIDTLVELFEAAGAAGFFAFYGVLGYLVHRRWLRRRIPLELTWTVSLLFLAAGVVLPPIAVLLVDPGSLGSHSVAVSIGNPWGPFGDGGYPAARAGCSLGLVALALAAVPIARQAWAFRAPHAPVDGAAG